MSREFKVSNIRQADDAINTVSERLTAARRQLNTQIEHARAEAARHAERAAREQSERVQRDLQAKLRSELRGVSENISRVDREQRQRLQRVAADLHKAITDVNEDIRNDMRGMNQRLKGEIGSLAERTRQSLKAIHRNIADLENRVDSRFRSQQSQIDDHSNRLDSQQRQLNDLTVAVNGILERFSDIDQKRREAVDLARGLRDAAFGRTDIARFCPEESRKIDERMNALLNNPNDEATAARAAEAMLQIQFAEEEAMRRKMIYDAVLAQALETLETVLGEVNSNRTSRVAYPDDPSAVADIETDFWCRGAYNAIVKRLNAMKAELESSPSVERVKQIIDEIAECEVTAADMVDSAARKAILSENRVTITEDIVDALLSQGWQLERDADGRDAVGYLGGDVENDWREGVFAVISSMNGERISIVVRPDDSELNNQIIFHRNDERNITDLDYRRSLQRIKEQIQRSGHRLGEIEVPEGGGDTKIPELADASRLRARGSAARINSGVRTRRH